jgi:hypothetical protein
VICTNARRWTTSGTSVTDLDRPQVTTSRVSKLQIRNRSSGAITVTEPTSGVSRRNLLKSAGIAGAAAASVAAVPATGMFAGATNAADATTALLQAGAVFGALQLAKVDTTALAATGQLGDFDDTHSVFADGDMEILLWPGDLARLEALGVRHEITVDNLQERDRLLREAAPTLRTADFAPGETANREYRMYEDFEADMRDLVDRYPGMARMVELEKRTNGELTVWGIEIATNVDANDGRPVVYHDGCHHAREWPAAEVPIMLAYDLLESYATDARVANIVDNTRHICVPVVNADGYSWSRNSAQQAEYFDLRTLGDAYWRKTRKVEVRTNWTEPVPTDSHGIDPNRNYAFAWGDDIGGSSSSKTSEVYRGQHPLSENESSNVAALLNSKPVTLLITHHTSGDLVLWPWGDADRATKDDPIHVGLGRAAAAYNDYEPKRSIFLYATTGTTMDYGYGQCRAISYTFEHAGSSFHPSYPSTVPAMYAKNRDAFLLMAEQAAMMPADRPDYDMVGQDPRGLAAQAEIMAELNTMGRLNHAVLTGRILTGGGKATLRITQSSQTPLWDNGQNPINKVSVPESLQYEMETDEDGSFTWHLSPSTHPHLEEIDADLREAYQLTVMVGNRGAFRSIVVERGVVTELGEISVS